jgi:hypothetical protein
MGLSLHPVSGCADTRPCWWVSDADGAPGRLGAGLLVRPDGTPLAFEVPSSAREPGTLPVAVELWRESKATALLFTASSTESPNPATYGYLRTAFQAFHQAVHRALPADTGRVLQLRGFSNRPTVNADVLVDVGSPVLADSQRPADLERLLSASGPMAWLGANVRYHDGSPEQAGLNDASPQQAFSRTFGGAKLATLWLSEPLRGAFVGPRRAAEELALTGLTPQAQGGSPEQLLLADSLGTPTRPVPASLKEHFAQLTTRVERYVLEQNVQDLRMLARPRQVGPVTQEVKAGYSPAHGMPYLVVEAREGSHVLRALYFLQQHPSPLRRAELVAGNDGLVAAVDEAVRHRRPVVLAGELSNSEGRP